MKEASVGRESLMLYVGLDIHSKFIQICVLDSAGEPPGLFRRFVWINMNGGVQPVQLRHSVCVPSRHVMVT
jgi:hypothetical protein